MRANFQHSALNLKCESYEAVAKWCKVGLVQIIFFLYHPLSIAYCDGIFAIFGNVSRFTIHDRVTDRVLGEQVVILLVDITIATTHNLHILAAFTSLNMERISLVQLQILTCNVLHASSSEDAWEMVAAAMTNIRIVSDPMSALTACVNG